MASGSSRECPALTIRVPATSAGGGFYPRPSSVDPVNSDEVRRQWAQREGEFSPRYYAHYGPDETSQLLRDHLDDALDPDAAVLELGCSSGRHLAHLRDHGYRNLHGVEINGDAFDVMRDVYPDLADSGTFYAEAIEDVVGGLSDDRFDAVYSVETLQHVHPDDEWVFGELARITGDRLLTVENEGAETDGDVNYVRDDVPLYYRDWGRVFGDRGLREIESRRLNRDTFRAFAAE